jgi:hypothetical protein
MGAAEKNCCVDDSEAHGHGDTARRVQRLMHGGVTTPVAVPSGERAGALRALAAATRTR